MIWIWKNGFPPLLLMMFQCLNFLSLMDSRWDDKTTRRRAALMLTLVMIVYWTCSILFNPFQRDPSRTVFVLLVPVLIFFWCMSKYRGLKFFATFCISDISIAAMDYMAYALGLHIWGEETLMNFGIRDVVIVLTYFVMRKFLHPHYKVALREMQSGWRLLLVLGIMSYLFMCFLPVYPTPINERTEDALISVMGMIVLEMMIVMVTMITDNIHQAQIKKQESEILQVQLGIANSQMKQIQDTMERSALLRHDLQHHLQMMRHLCEQGEYNRLHEYIDQQLKETSLSVTPLCHNKTVNLYLNYYKSHCTEQGIEFICNADVPEKLPVQDTALVVLLGNLLSNAVTACEQISYGDRRWIEVQLVVRRETLLIKVQNSCVEKPVFEDGVPVSQRGGKHGFGVVSIRNVTEKSGGYARWAWENGVFTAEAVLPLQEKVLFER